MAGERTEFSVGQDVRLILEHGHDAEHQPLPPAQQPRRGGPKR